MSGKTTSPAATEDAQPPCIFTGTGSDKPTPRTKTMGMFGYIPDAFTSKSLQFDGDTTPRHKPASGGGDRSRDTAASGVSDLLTFSGQSKAVNGSPADVQCENTSENGDVSEKVDQSVASDEFAGFDPVSKSIPRRKFCF